MTKNKIEDILLSNIFRYKNKIGVINIILSQPYQRYIYKIHSERLRKNRWNLFISMEEARKNEEIISLADSQIMRFIDDIHETNSASVGKKIYKIRCQINCLTQKSRTTEIQKKIKVLYEQLDSLQFVPEYMCLIIDKLKDYDRANKGFSINGLQYRRLLGTTNGVKNQTIVYVCETSSRGKPIYEELKKRINNGRDETIKLVPGKFEAYQSLVCSSSVPVSDPKGILVVPDCETTFLSDYINIDDSDSDEPIIKMVHNGKVSLIDSDGYGLMCPALAKRWSAELQIDYIMAGCCDRNAFNKGMLFTFDFHEFAHQIAKKQFVTDVWGEIHDIDTIEMIIPVSKLKLWDSYPNIDSYITNCKKNQYTFSITKVCPPRLENVRTLNYQFIQSYSLSDEDIVELASDTIQEIQSALGDDINQTILFLKGMQLNENNIENIHSDFVKALMVDPHMINDPYVQSKIQDMIKKRIDEAKIGVLRIHGNYSIVSGDPFSFCQHIFGMEVTGLLKAGQAYNQYWLNKKTEKVVCFRAPMTCHNNIRILNITENDDMKHWFQYMDTVTIFNSWDMAAHALNGLDKDSDSILTTDNPILLRNTRMLPAIQCIQKKSQKQTITEESQIIANKNSFGDEIGATTNHITSMFEKQAEFPLDSKEYAMLDYRIKCGQLYQQNCIDKIKGIVSKPMPVSWYRSSAINEGDNSLQLSIVANKKPYFMNYIYPNQKKLYNSYVENANKKSLIEFKKTLTALLEMDNTQLSNEEAAFLSYFHSQMPVGTGKCVMNRICRYVEKVFEQYFLRRKSNNSDFNCEIIKSNVEYSKQTYKKIDILYRQYQQQIQNYKILSKKMRIDVNEVSNHKKQMKYQFRRDAICICPNKYELCDIVIDICYTTKNSKQFCWDIAGDIIVENLLHKNKNMIKYLVADDNGDIEFLGEKFAVRYKTLGGNPLWLSF